MTQKDSSVAQPRTESVCLVRRNGQWEIAKGHLHPSAPLALTDEGDFMRCILNEGIPLPLGDSLFRPVCCEFPSSPGVDMVWASDDGQFALGELKAEFRGYPNPCAELAHHYLRVEDMAVGALAAFAARKPGDASSDAQARLDRLLKENPGLDSSTFGALLASGRLHLAVMFASAPAQLPSTPVPFVAAHVVPRRDGSASVRLSVPAQAATADARPNLVHLAGQYRAGLARTRSLVARVARTPDDSVSTYLGRPAGDPARIVVEGALGMGLHAQPGTGSNPGGLRFTVESKAGTRRPLLCFTRPDTLFLQTNLISYHKEFGVPRDVIASAFDRVAAAFPLEKCTQTASSRRPKFNLRGFSPSDAANLLRIVGELLGQLRR
jgi:hypothetical protein